MESHRDSSICEKLRGIDRDARTERAAEGFAFH